MAHKTRTLTRWLALPVLVLGLLLVCDNPFSPKIIPPRQVAGLENTSFLNVLENLQTAYNSRNLLLFQSLLAADFKFVVNPEFVWEPTSAIRSEDIDNDGQLESYWDRDREIRLHSNMFEKAKTINLSFSIPDSSEWEPWNHPQTEEKIGIYVNIENAQLDITTADQKYYRLQRSTQKFGMKRNPNNENLWVIGEWHDER